MSQEILDIVDGNNNVVGKDLRTNIHLRGYFHRSVHIFVINRKGELYVQKRAASLSSFPGYFDSSAAGHVSSGESYEESAARELEEELGISGVKLRLLTVFDASQETGYEFTALFLCHYDGEIRINAKEVSSGSFVRPGDIDAGKGKFTPNFKRCLMWFLQNGNRFS